MRTRNRLLLLSALSTVGLLGTAQAEPSHADRVTECITLIGKMHYPPNLEAVCARDKAKCQKLVDEWAHWIKAARPECERATNKVEMKEAEEKLGAKIDAGQDGCEGGDC